MFIVETKDIPLRTLLYVLLILIIFIVNIFVAKLSSTTTSEDLQALFSEHGSVSSAKVIMDRETGNSKCFGFVEMEDETEGFNAINALNETEFQGRKIVVKKARPREEGGDDRGQRFPSLGRRRHPMWCAPCWAAASPLSRRCRSFWEPRRSW